MGYSAAWALLAGLSAAEAYAAGNIALFKAFAASPAFYQFGYNVLSSMVGGYQVSLPSGAHVGGCEEGLCVTSTLRAITGKTDVPLYDPSKGMNGPEAAAEAQAWLTAELSKSGYSLKRVNNMISDGGYVVILSGNRLELHMMFGQRVNAAFTWHDMGKVIGNDNGMFLDFQRSFWGTGLRIWQVINP